MEKSNPTEAKKSDTPIGKILRAVETKDKVVMTTALNEVNQILTGHSQAHFKDEKTLSEEVDRVLDAIENGYTETVYLGDSGLSRLVVGMNLDKPVVEISGVPTEEIKTKWGNLQAEYNQAK